MKKGDAQLGFPNILYTGAQAVIETLDDVEGSFAYANDIEAIGFNNGADWSWLPLSAGINTFLVAGNNLSDLTNVATARTNLGLVAGGAGDIWVEKAGDTMTGQLFIDGGSDQIQLLVQGNGTQTNNLAVFESSGGTDLVWIEGTGATTIAVPTATVNGLSLKSTDNNDTNPLLRAISSTNVELFRLAHNGANASMRFTSSGGEIDAVQQGTTGLELYGASGRRVHIYGDSVLKFTVSAAGVGIGVNPPTSVFHVVGSSSVASAAGAVWDTINFAAATATISGSTNITTATGFNYWNIARPTLSAGSALTITHAATLYIVNSPLGAGAGPATITNAYAIWVDDGNSRFDGKGSFGTSISSTSQLRVQQNTGGTGATAIDARMTTGTNALEHFTIFAQLSPTSVNQTATGSSAPTAIFASMSALTAHTHSELTSLAGYLNYDNSVSITVWNGLKIHTPVTGGSGGTIATAYGVFVADQNVATTNYAIRTNIGRVSLLGSTTIASASGATWGGIEERAATATITGSTSITTATGFNFHSIAQPTLSAGSALTITNAATLYIAGAPVGAGAGPATITNAYAIWVDAGFSRFDGTVQIRSDTTNDIMQWQASNGVTYSSVATDGTWTIGVSSSIQNKSITFRVNEYNADAGAGTKRAIFADGTLFASTSQSGTYRTIDQTTAISGTAAFTNLVYGFWSQFSVNNSSGTNARIGAYGASIAFGGAATTTLAIGYEVIAPSLSSGTVTTFVGLLINDITIAGTNKAIETNAGLVVFNEGGHASADLRWESDTETHMLFGDADGDTDGSLYIGGTTNGVKIKKGGLLSFLGTASIETDVKLSVVGKGLYVKEGSNATMGVATLVGGTVTVNTTKVTASSRIFLTPQTLGTIARPAAVGVTARVNGTSFTITSGDATDTSDVAWMIVEPA